MKRVLLVCILLAGILLGYPISIPAGFILSLLCGHYLRQTVFGASHRSLRTADGLLIGFSEAFMFSVILLSPLAYILPFLLGQVDFVIVVSLITLVLGFLAAYLNQNQSTKESNHDDIQDTGLTPWIAVALWIGVAFYDLMSSIHMFYGSFDGLFFMFADLTNQLNLIQGIAAGTFPQPNLTFFGSSLAENPLALTLSLGYSGIMITSLNLQAFGDIFVIIMKMYIHSAIVPLIYYVARGVAARIPAWAFIVSVLGLAIGMDLAPFQQLEGTYEAPLNRGVFFPWDRPEMIASDFYAPGLGAESVLSSFHHLLPILVFMFVIGLMLRITEWNSRRFIVAAIASIELLLFHIGIAFFLVGALAITFLGIFLSVVLKIERFAYRILLYKIGVVAALSGLYLLRDFVSSFVLVTLRYTDFEILDSLVVYLGPFTLLGAIGYLLMYRVPNCYGKWAIIVAFDLVLLEASLFSLSRDSGLGLVPTDYFPLFNLQAVVVMVFLIGLSWLYATPISKANVSEVKWGPAKPIVVSLTSFQIPKNWQLYSHRVVQVSFILSLFAISGLHAGWFFSENLGKFNEGFYGEVPTVSFEERVMFQWIHDNSDIQDTIACSPQNWEIAAMIGRQILYSGYRAPWSEDLRYQAYLGIYNSTTLDDKLALLQEYRVSLIVLSPVERSSFPLGISKFYSSTLLNLEYSSGMYEVFRVIEEDG